MKRAALALMLLAACGPEPVCKRREVTLCAETSRIAYVCPADGGVDRCQWTPLASTCLVCVEWEGVE